MISFEVTSMVISVYIGYYLLFIHFLQALIANNPLWKRSIL